MTFSQDGASHADAEILRFAELTLDFGGKTLRTADGRDISLTRGELILLYALVRSRGRVLSRDQLLDVVAARRAEPFDRSIDVMVGRLRRKIEPDPKTPHLVVTVAGFGYRLGVPVQLVASAEFAREPETKPTEITHFATERRHITTLAAELLAWENASLPADPEALRDLISRYRHYVAAIITRYGGVVRETRGRQVLAFFGYPQAQEHIAERAVHAALALVSLQSPDLSARGLLSGGTDKAALPNGITMRVGVTSGLVIAEPAGEVLGEAPGEAERLLNLAEPRQVIIGASTRQLSGGLFAYRELDPLTVKGIAEPLRPLRVLGPTTFGSRSEALYFDTPTPLVGRDKELSLLLRAWEQTKVGGGRLVLLSGEPGIGKSRLLVALEKAVATEPRISQRYFCSALHQDSALYPIIARLIQEADFDRADSAAERLGKLEAVLARSDLPPEDVLVIAGLLSIPTGGRYPQPEFSPQRRRERIFGALLRRLVNLARKQPVLVLCEDAQWADPSSLELLDALLGRLGQLPILLVISYRTEFSAPWIGRPGASLILLNRLTHQESAALATQVTAERVLASAALERIITQTDGVPLFIEELTKAVLEASADAEGTTLPLMVPSTLQASLMARLDRLPVAKQVAQIGAVIGREFTHRLLAAVAHISQAEYAQGLDELVASGLASRRGISEDAVYTFKHALVQDAAYQSLLRRRRAEIHAAIVAASECDTSLAIDPGVLGHHCAEAGLIAKAADNYRLAGKEAAERAASVETRIQLERGLGFASTLPDGFDRHRLEAELLLALVDVLQITRGYASAEADEVSERAIQLCRRLHDRKLLFRALAARISLFSTRGEMAEAQSLAQEALDFKVSNEALLSVFAQTGMGGTLLWQGRFAEAREHLATAVALTVRSSEAARWESRSDVYGYVNLALTLACLGYLRQAARQAQLAIDWATSRGSFALAYVLSNVGAVMFILRDDAALRERNTAQIALCEEHGYLQVLASGQCVLGWLEAKQGRVDQGLRLLRSGLISMHDLGVVFGLPLHYSLEADALAWGGQQTKAIAVLDKALGILDRTGDTWWAAELYRRRGELLLTGSEPNARAAEQELLQAIRIARDQSAKLFKLRAAITLGRVWVTQGKHTEARDLLGPIYSWFTEGFDAPDLKEAKALLDELA